MNFLVLPFIVALLSVMAASQSHLRTKGAKECADDVGNATKDLAAAGAAIARAVTTCEEGFTEQCNLDISLSLKSITDAANDLTAAVYDCSGETPTACSADVNACLADVTGATSAVMNAVLDCQNTEDLSKCRKDVSTASELIVQLGIDIARAVEDC